MERYRSLYESMYGKLSKRQMRILDQAPPGVLAYDDLPVEMIEELESINNYETLWTDAERYIGDKEMDRMYGER